MRFPLPTTPAAQAGQAFRPPAPPARAERSLHLADAGTAAGACGARVDGKFFRRADERVYLAGVTYGPFAPGAQGEPYHPQRTAEDFAAIAAAGFNSVRLYTPPPLWLLDLAVEHGLGVLGGTAWEQHVTFLDDRRRAAAIAARVAGDIRARAGHAALLGWAIGNEIPAPIVRWHGPGRIRASWSGCTCRPRRPTR